MMTTIEHLIGNLLLRHNCVIVPSFGGFVAKQISATINYNKGTMLPPSKSLLFNKQLINNDGLLINELSQSLGLSFDEAQDEVRNKVSEWNSLLKKGARIELDRVGMLYADEENNICFEQDRFFNLLLASFGLGQVHFLTGNNVNLIQVEALSKEIVVDEPQKELTPIVSIAPPQTEKITGEPKEKKQVRILKPAQAEETSEPAKKRKYLRYVAAACILPIAFYSIWIPMQTDVLESGVISIKDFNPFYSTSDGNYMKSTFTEDVNFEKSTAKTLDQEIDEIETDVDVFKLAFTEDTYIIVDINDLSTQIQPIIDDNTTNTTIETPISVNSQHLIIGCFGIQANATNFVAKLKSEGLHALIVDVTNGLHRVSAGAALSKEALKEIRSKAESLGYQGWVLN